MHTAIQSHCTARATCMHVRFVFAVLLHHGVVLAIALLPQAISMFTIDSMHCACMCVLVCNVLQADGSGLIVTVARYETPRGTNIQGQGIKPDINTPLPKVTLSILLTTADTQSEVSFLRHLQFCRCLRAN
jgi:Peptidase family S41